MAATSPGWLRHIIIQAGGRGTRLEGLTRNKPKCMVSVRALPLIFHAFRRFPGCRFTIIADYRAEVLRRYLQAFAGGYDYHLVITHQQGTLAGISEALEDVPEGTPFMLLWSDLLLPPTLQLPAEPGNYLGMAGDFECRWSYVPPRIVERPSYEDGIAGLFIFEHRGLLADLPAGGALVEWLAAHNPGFERLELPGVQEVGTLLAFNELETPPRRCRPFNELEFTPAHQVVKRALTEHARRLAADEGAWYRHVRRLGYANIPVIHAYEPLTMERVQGRNIFEYDLLLGEQKREILDHLLAALSRLHQLEPPRPATAADCEACYLSKTFERLDQVRALIPLAGREVICINGFQCRNVLFMRGRVEQEVRALFPREFCLIHGDCTFSNLMFDTFDMQAVLIDPRGYFGSSRLYGDVDYDWAKLYYSLCGDYDQFNLKRFSLDIREDGVELSIRSNGWSDMEDYFFERIAGESGGRRKIKLLHALIWLSLTTYVWDDYDSICAAFYNGLLRLNEVL